ncbi:MAG: tRNA (N6-isopentenyl adenosine(37)-C2)-methylthiotransferase MiaB [Desulfopila sp.]
MQKTVFIKTFGCQMNERDSEIMFQALSSMGYSESADMESADLVILNTCSIRAKAEQKVMSLLGLLRKIKQDRKEMQICVAGCVAQQEGEKLLERMPHVDLVIGTQNIYAIGELLEQVKRGRGLVAVAMTEGYEIPRFLPQTGSEAGDDLHSQRQPLVFQQFVTIMQGCNNFCAYCVVPYTRGREVSRKVHDIVDEVDKLVQRGVKEITLLGQNVNSYGRTNRVADGGLPYSFADLLHRVAAVPGLARLRFTTSNPKDLSDELMCCFREIEVLCPQFHLPVQAGSDSVLQRMNRKYSVNQYLELVSRLRTYRPDIALSTDVIVGFPGETEEDFQGTMDLLEQVRYHGSFSFKYSDRPGTRASTFEDKVPEEIKSERLMRFQTRQNEISLARNREYLNQIKTVLIEEVHSEAAKGRTDTNHIVHIPEAARINPGEFHQVRIGHAGHHSLRGNLILTSMAGPDRLSHNET